LPESSDISFRCRVPEKQVDEWLRELKKRQLVDELPTGELVIHDWNEHQFVSDNVTERVRKHRAKRKGNVSVTPPEQNRTEYRTEQNTHTRARRSEKVQIEPEQQVLVCVPESAAIPAPKTPRAADLTQPVSTRFDEFWERWPRKTGRDAAASAWCSYVTKENEQKVFACLERFLRSGDVARGAIPNAGPAPGKAGWLADCFRDQWECNWPAAPANGNGHKAGASVLRHEDRKPPSTEELIRAHESQAENDRDPAAREFSRKWLQEHARRG